MADTDTVQSLADLKNVVDGTVPAAGTDAVAIDPATLPDPKIDELGRSYATGKRKNSIARVWIKPGNGKITINGRDQEVYFARPVLRLIIAQAFRATRVLWNVRNTAAPKRVRASSSLSVKPLQTFMVYVFRRFGSPRRLF